MFIPNLLLPLLSLSALTSIEAKPTHGRKSNHLHHRNFNPIRRTSPPEGLEAHVVRRNKDKKRTVRKKRGSCKVRTNSTLSSSSSTSSTIAVVDMASTVASSSSASVSTSISAEGSSASSGSLSSASSSVYTSAEASITAVSASSSYAASTTISSSAASASTTSTTNTSDWYLVETVSGSNFFDAWSFWSYDDPTHGTVEYVDETTAWSDGLISINSAGNAIMKADTTETVTDGRKAVRIHSNRIWTGGLMLMDAVHLPTGCGTWPAWWMNGPNWPNGGEIDIIEGVNAFSENQVSLHTGDGCTMPSTIDDGQTGALTTSSDYDAYNCASYATSNQGCGVRAGDDNSSYGPGFNAVNGGVYAMKWDKTGIAVWWFPRSTIPTDITNDVPTPSTWGTPMAYFPATDCDPYTYFYDNFAIFTNTFCGDWAGADGVWNYAGYAGQSESCAAMTGYSTCSEYVLNQGSAFADAYWEVSYVKYFNSTTEV